MNKPPFRVIDPRATGANILRLRKARGLSVRDLQAYFGFEEPQAIYKWQWGQSLPSVDNLYALSALLGVQMEEILVPMGAIQKEQQADAACCSFVRSGAPPWETGRKCRADLTNLRPAVPRRVLLDTGNDRQILFCSEGEVRPREGVPEKAGLRRRKGHMSQNDAGDAVPAAVSVSGRRGLPCCRQNRAALRFVCT